MFPARHDPSDVAHMSKSRVSAFGPGQRQEQAIDRQAWRHLDIANVKLGLPFLPASGAVVLC